MRDHAQRPTRRIAGRHAARRVVLRVFGLLLAVLPAAWAEADVARVLPEGKLPDDRRLGPLTDLNGYFPFQPAETPQAWQQRAERLRRQLLVSNGLWPMPTATPLRPVIHGAVDRGGYTVERVYFESLPGHYVTGSLYRPKGFAGRRPGVLSPHGHWGGGRFHDHGAALVEKEIERGGEKFEIGGRHPLQARCVQLARMGCVVFHYDMLGYADSQQIPHRPGVREQMNTPENWGFFSPRAEAHLQNMMGLQTFNSIRALDFLAGLSDVDPERIAVTGASGGGTQTFMLAAVDPRPAVAFPAVMVSTAMQGGCTCENACYLRVGTGNVEIAALFAPKPQGLTAANDWTKEMPEKGFPELKRHYEMLGAPDRVMLAALLQFGHNYNYPSRQAMYGWLNKHLKLGFAEPIEEEDYRPLSKEEMTVWGEGHPAPPGGEEHERAVLRWWTEDAQGQLAALEPKDAASLAEFRRVIGGAWDVMIGRGLPEPNVVGATSFFKPAGDQFVRYSLARGTLNNRGHDEALPFVTLSPPDWNKRTVVWIDPRGKAGLFDEQGRPRRAVARLLAFGVKVVGVDLFGQGEFTEDGKPVVRQRYVGQDREGPPRYAGYTYGYNHPLFAQRVHDILSVVALAKAERIDLVGVGGAGHWVAAARAQAGSAVDRVVIDTAGFRFAAVDDVYHADFLPGAVKYGDLPAALALGAPGPLWLAGEGDEAPGVVAAAYRAAGAEDKLHVSALKAPAEVERAAVEWLLK
jgi:dienelactone hydrolase